MSSAFPFLSEMDVVGIHVVHRETLCVLLKRAALFYCEYIVMLPVGHVCISKSRPRDWLLPFQPHTHLLIIVRLINHSIS